MKWSLYDAINIAYNKSIAPENTRWQTTHSGTRQVTAGRGTARFKTAQVIQDNLSFLHSIVILQSNFAIIILSFGKIKVVVQHL